jgi:Ribosomal protein S19E (S16A)
MITIHDVEPGKFNKKLAEELSTIEEFAIPEWANCVKTSVSRSRPPAESDWWYKRTASILRQIYLKGVVGVSKLKKVYGGKKDRGSRTKELRKGSGKIIRVILQQAEKAGFVKKSEGKRKGRELTKKGLEFMNKISESVK